MTLIPIRPVCGLGLRGGGTRPYAYRLDTLCNLGEAVSNREKKSEPLPVKFVEKNIINRE